jgi:hypothetical protein
MTQQAGQATGNVFNKISKFGSSMVGSDTGGGGIMGNIPDKGGAGAGGK